MMRKEFVRNRALSSHTDLVAAMDFDEVRELCPWAVIIEEVYGGWWAFESVDDHLTWVSQD